MAIGQTVEAVTMPVGLGRRVQAQLAIAMQSGPVTTNPEGGRWTFLTQPVDRLRANTTADLSHMGVTVAPRGSYVVVPASPTLTTGLVWRWIERPAPARVLPPAYAVIAVARRLAGSDHLQAA
ncbi:bifunctional DNA primase/polymerase [Actinophytocola sp. NPDC049390]|uniref:bifunctional DNA primase/polymerase n=1 Tax=Actinophytocola sp. NPDC049390 TaxID=3363894 RepID=UPI00378897A0